MQLRIFILTVFILFFSSSAFARLYTFKSEGQQAGVFWQDSEPVWIVFHSPCKPLTCDTNKRAHTLLKDFFNAVTKQQVFYRANEKRCVNDKLCPTPPHEMVEKDFLKVLGFPEQGADKTFTAEALNAAYYEESESDENLLNIVFAFAGTHNGSLNSVCLLGSYNECVALSNVYFADNGFTSIVEHVDVDMDESIGRNTYSLLINLTGNIKSRCDSSSIYNEISGITFRIECM